MKNNYLLLFFLSLCTVGFAQDDDLLKMIENEKPKVVETVSATFKGIKVINGHSVETVGKKNLVYGIQHRFGRINGGAYQFFGLDQATMRMYFEYGLTDNLMVGIGRSTNEKTYDGFLKYKMVKQGIGAGTWPVTITALGATSYRSLKLPLEVMSGVQRTTYVGQLLIARKFSENFSLQISPTLVHRNLTNTNAEENNVFAVGFSGRYKLSRRFSLTGEYYYTLPDQIDVNYQNALSFGVDIETGGHVFQLHFTNSLGMIERQFITETTGTWGKGDVHFGFNLARTFTLGRRDKANMIK
jgi:Membrane bound beta barrel domain (DUF5777)